MEKETLLLNSEETTILTALGLIGIGLPQHYGIALAKFQHLVKEKGLGEITIDDAVRIKYDTEKEWNWRYNNPETFKNSIQ